MDRLRSPALLSALLLLGACASSDSSRVLGVLRPPRPMDELAKEAAERLLAAPETLSLNGANGLSRLGACFEREDWIAAGAARFEARLEDPRPLAESEAAAFRERWAEVDLDMRWRSLLEREGRPYDIQPPVPRQAFEACQAAMVTSDPNQLLWAWGRARDWFGHVWIDGARSAMSLDGIEIQPDNEDGWRAHDLLGVSRAFALRRAGDNGSLMWIEANGSVLIPARFGGEGHEHGH